MVESLVEQEKDAVVFYFSHTSQLEVIAALNKESEVKNTRIRELNHEIKGQEDEIDRAKIIIQMDHDSKIHQMASVLTEKEAAVKIMQREFEVIKEFRVRI
jgi:hypothetical protein